MGQVHEQDGYLYGRLGFESTAGADLWKEDRLDFEATEVPAGVASPFAVRLTDLAIVFQTRAQDIRVTSFTGAMRGILREATGENWDVVTVSRETTFQQWRRSVDIVTRLRFRLERPNPNYEGRPDVERLIERLHVKAATLDFRSEDEGINTEDDLARQMFDHVDRNYGQAVAAGEREIDGQRVETVWDSDLRGESLVTQAPVDPDTGEVTVDYLIHEVATIEVTQEL